MVASSSYPIDSTSARGARRRNLGAIVLLALALTACADNEAVAPNALPWGGLSTGRAPAGIPSPDVVVHYVADDSLSAEFTVTPTGGVFNLGPHAIYFPAHSICDPATSTYGPGEWDAPCAPLTEPIRFRAEIRQMDGRSWVDFSPAVRFVPTEDPANAVWLYMKTTSLSTDSDSALRMLRRMSVLYSPSLGDPGINEALADPSLKTYVWLDGGVAFRRIKHFSGYNVYTGRMAGDALDDDFADMGGDGMEFVDDMIVPVRY
jgi:hypothetical protein